MVEASKLDVCDTFIWQNEVYVVASLKDDFIIVSLLGYLLNDIIQPYSKPTHHRFNPCQIVQPILLTYTKAVITS